MYLYVLFSLSCLCTWRQRWSWMGENGTPYRRMLGRFVHSYMYQKIKERTRGERREQLAVLEFKTWMTMTTTTTTMTTPMQASCTHMVMATILHCLPFLYQHMPTPDVPFVHHVLFSRRNSNGRGGRCYLLELHCICFISISVKYISRLCF